MDHYLTSVSSPELPRTVAAASGELSSVALGDPAFLLAVSALLKAVELVREGVKRPRAHAEGSFDRIIESHAALPDEGEGRVDRQYGALAAAGTMAP